MTHDEKGRIDNAEKAIVGLSGRLDGVESRLGHVEVAVGETNEGVNKLLARTGGLEQTRGMIPVTHIWAAAALFASLLGIGITMLTLYNNNIRSEILEDRTAMGAHAEDNANTHAQLKQEMRELDQQNMSTLSNLDKFIQLELSSAAELNEAKHDNIRAEIERRFAYTGDDLAELESSHKDFRDTYFIPLEDRVRSIETTKARSEDISDMKDRIAALEVFAARIEERVQKALDEITDHEDELDHPGRQTYEIDGIKRELKQLQPVP